MAQQPIKIGSHADDGSGDPLRVAFNKINQNFDEVYAALAALTTPVGQDFGLLGPTVVDYGDLTSPVTTYINYGTIL